ncbi:class I SAM-dependent methyltransferase [Rhodobium gokarnense]|uniref:S-adenosyl-L-methionine methyltransferase n=1 Tax=Rhodobium gokarnense TaxID=364296 RepID=A0ABT3HDE1_9HYPH|nr:class I SAM-dependent methyltransferase [Rhodobium gokarnense]MCW2308406.1 hypothetical protein [Rhodobium gokarnense]
MSRLEAFIDRMVAQKRLLEHTARLIADVPGPVLELGLGNGRSFDHLREILPGREIFAFDRSITAHPSCVPDGEHMIVGEIRETLKFCGPRVKRPAALVNIDLGTADETAELAIVHWLSPLIEERVAPGGYVLSDLALDLPDFDLVAKPEGTEACQHQLFQKRGMP